MDGAGGNWSDTVEDLVDQDDVDGAIAVLESVVAELETQQPPPPPGDLRLATALSDLADLYSSRGFSLKADDLRSRALLLRTRALSISSPKSGDPVPAKGRGTEREDASASIPSDQQGEDEDDWEAIADRSDDLLLPSRGETAAPPALSSTYFEDKDPVGPKRRGRGSFLYKKSCLYSDQPDVRTTSDDISGSEDEADERGRQSDNGATGVMNSIYGTGHVLVLYDFPPSTRTIELERLFETFRDRGVAIRWVDDTIALAVFRTPSLAHEAQSSVRCSFKVRALGEDDILLTRFSTEDLEPPYPRPKTSARTAQRLIAQVMGIKPSTNFGSNELRIQEEARKNRILARQNMKDDAWGSDNQ